MFEWDLGYGNELMITNKLKSCIFTTLLKFSFRVTFFFSPLRLV